MNDYLFGGKSATFFPTVKKEEARLGLIFMACLQHVPEFAQGFSEILPRGTVGKINEKGVRARLEVSYGANEKKSDEEESRIDAILIKDYPKGKEWKAFFEFKTGSNKINPKQIEKYHGLAKKDKIDTLITISNDFTSSSEILPYEISFRKTDKVKIFHISWSKIRTLAHTLANDNSNEIEPLKKLILSHFEDFMSHKDSGCLKYNAMPKGWQNFVKSISEENINKQNEQIDTMASAWQQEIDDLCLDLARLSNDARVRLDSREAKLGASERLKNAKEILLKDSKFKSSINIPSLSSPMNIEADFKRKSISFSISTDAPPDAKTSLGSISWLRKGFSKFNDWELDDDRKKVVDADHITIMALWVNTSEKNSMWCDFSKILKGDNAEMIDGMKDKKIKKFIIKYSVELGANFSKPVNFINNLEREAATFYTKIAYHVPIPPSRAKPKIIEHHDFDSDSAEGLV